MPDADDDTPAWSWDRALAEHEARLTVGARVRVMPGEGCYHHGTQEAGVTGVILDIDTRSYSYHPAATHPYLVLFDRPLGITRSSMAGWYYSASELTPIPWRTPEEVVADTLKLLDAGAEE